MGNLDFLKYTIVVLFLILFLLLLLNFTQQKETHTNQNTFYESCSDGTEHGNCSDNKPDYCDNGSLIQSPEFCSCPEGYEFNENNCIEILTCEDGTRYSECSNFRPFYCDNGTLVEHSTLCGCPSNYVVKNESCIHKANSTKPEVTVGSLEIKIHDLVNQERINHSLEPLELDEELSEVARLHSVDMGENNYFSHYNSKGEGPTERGLDLGYVCEKTIGNYAYSGLGENIYQNNLYDYVTYLDGEVLEYGWNTEDEIAETTVQGWMDSESHKTNILEDSYDAGGIGVYIADNDNVYITHDFC